MSKKLAIKGHPTRGKEVIEILEMTGGKNIHKLLGSDKYAYYVIEGCRNEIRAGEYIFGDEDMCFFTLEEFLEKYPFKVGELKYLTDDHISCVISEMRWNAQAECVEYHAEFGSNDYGWYRVYDFCHDYQIEEFDKVISSIYLNSYDYADEVELNLGDYEIEVRGNRTYAVKKKSKYPETFEECLNLLYCKSILRPIIGHKAELLLNLEKLLICRNAYWKIAGEEMGLGKSWEPVYIALEDNTYFTIQTFNGEIDKSATSHRNAILAFPTIEMRDAFYENFKDLIEQCKELL